MSGVERGGDWGGGSRTEEISCPLCGDEITNQALPSHLTKCPEGGGRDD